MREAAGALEQFLQVAFGNAFGLRHAGRRKIGIAQPALDGLTDTVEDCALCRAARGFRGRAGLAHEGRQQVCEALRHGCPFDVGQGFQRARRRIERARENLGEAAWRHDTHAGGAGLSDLATAKRLRCDRQHDRPHVALERDAPVAVARQQQQLPGGNDLMPGSGAQRDAFLGGQQHDRHVVCGVPQRR
jgi:hypothetical protein